MNNSTISENSFKLGLLAGILIGEGHFGGDGKQAQVTLRMHSRHENLFRWFLQMVPGSKLYGPYYHGGRDYYQWMARGEPLKKVLIPYLEQCGLDVFDPPTAARYREMIDKYHLPKSN